MVCSPQHPKDGRQNMCDIFTKIGKKIAPLSYIVDIPIRVQCEPVISISEVTEEQHTTLFLIILSHQSVLLDW